MTRPGRRKNLNRRGFSAVLLAVLTALQVTGAVHFALELVAFVDGDVSTFADSGCDDCDDESCPPGCPTCHHAAPRLAAGLRSSIEIPPLAVESSAPLVVLPEVAPPSRAIAPLDRPPRIAA